jgi:flagellar hook-length control protein FliK
VQPDPGAAADALIATTTGTAGTTTGTKTTGVKATTTAAGKTSTGTTAATTPATTVPSATTDGSQTNPAAQPTTTDGKDLSANPVSDAAKAAGTAPVQATAAASTHDHSAAAGNGQPTATADPNAQAAVVPQQLSTTAPATAATDKFTVAQANNGAVPLSGIAVQIAASVQSGKTRFEMRLDPADLGRIDVRIDVDRNGQVTSHLTVEKPETLSMLQQDAPQLQQALNDAGLKTGNGGLQFSLRDQSSSGQNTPNNQGGGHQPQRLVITEDNTVPAAAAGRSYGRMLGNAGGVDIRV